MSSLTAAPRLSEAPARSAAAKIGSPQVLAAVREASDRTGVDFSYLLEKAAVESGGRTDVKAATSSATGLYQFIDSTWLNTLAQHGGEHGLGQYATAIQRRSDGSPFVADPDLRREILDLRKDPRVSALLAAEFTRDNKQFLETAVGGDVGPTEMYMAHFLGAGGAARFLQAMRQTPERPAAALFPEAASSNRAVFYERDSGRPLSLKEIYNRFAARFGDLPETVVADTLPGGSGSGGSGGGRAAGGGFGGVANGDPSRQLIGQPLSMYTVLTLNALDTPLDEERTAGSRQDRQNRKVRDEMTSVESFSGSQPRWMQNI